MNALNFDHAHHTLKIRGLNSPPDVLSFEGREHLSQPFCYDIQFTSRDKTLEPEAVLMQDGALSLCAPPVQGMPVQMPLRTLYGVITGFKQLSTSRDETRYEVRLEPRLALLARSHQNAIYQNQSVPQIVEKSCGAPRDARPGLRLLPGGRVPVARTGDAVRRGRPDVYLPAAGGGGDLVPVQYRCTAEN
jgi:uncharacterized protein involved in type VI secretion and phage assembly